jgi:hypothetical protein
MMPTMRGSCRLPAYRKARCQFLRGVALGKSIMVIE